MCREKTVLLVDAITPWAAQNLQSWDWFCLSWFASHNRHKQPDANFNVENCVDKGNILTYVSVF
jgi:hypothetical protein